jgi:hypothetical protein
MGFFPSKKFITGAPREKWEVDMFTSLDESLTKAIYTIKETGSSRIVQKSVYIQYLITQEKLKRLKHVRTPGEDDNGASLSDLSNKNE